MANKKKLQVKEVEDVDEDVDVEDVDTSSTSEQILQEGENVQLGVNDEADETVIVFSRTAEWHDELMETIGSFMVAHQEHEVGNKIGANLVSTRKSGKKGKK